MPQPAQASVDATTVRERFNYDWAESNPIDGVDTWWWYAVSVRIDPNEVWAEDDEGDLWVVPFSTDGEDAVTFGVPTRSRLVAVPVTTTDGAAATAMVSRRRQRALASGLERPDKPDRSTHPAASQAAPTQEDQVPDITPDQLQRLRALPEDATQEQINDTLADIVDELDQAAVTAAAAEAARVAAESAEAEQAAAAAAASADPIEAERARVLQETTERIARLEAEATTRTEGETKTRRDGLATAWVHEGRISPAEHDHYRGLLDVDETRTVALASSLAKGRVPVTGQIGTAASADTSGVPTTTGWFPQLQKKEG